MVRVSLSGECMQELQEESRSNKGIRSRSA